MILSVELGPEMESLTLRRRDAENAELRGEERSGARKTNATLIKGGKRQGRSAILSLSSAAAPLGAGFICGEKYRGGISDVDRTRPD